MAVDGAVALVGIDWASQEHAVCAVNPDGRVLASFSIKHSAEGFARLVARLGKLGEREAVWVAIERPDGRLVDRLLEAGHPVVPVSPNTIVMRSENVSAGRSEVSANLCSMTRCGLGGGAVV